MQFGNLHFLWLLLLIPCLVIFYLLTFRSKRRMLKKFIANDVWQYLLKSVSLKKQRVKPIFFILGVFCLILALSQPKWGYHWEKIKRRGLDIVVALDVSKSMLAEDIKPNRLEAAKREIKNLINMLKGDRIGIVAFSGTAFLQCPLTLDYGTAKLFLDYLNTDIIPLGGTDIGGAIQKTIRAFEGHGREHCAMILITDGEDHRGNVMAAVKEAKNKGIVIFSVGVGKGEGAPIPVLGKDGKREFLKNNEGKIVVSKPNMKLLQKIALMTGGRKGVIGTGNFPLEEIYQKELSKMEKKELESSRQKQFENRFQYFLFAAILFFVLETIFSERKRQ